MFFIFEKILLFIGASANFLLIFNLLIRPVLWSTINTFLGSLLAINFLYILVEICLYNEISQINDKTEEDEIVQSLDHLFSHHYKSVLCSAQYLSGYILRSFSLFVMLGTIFIRIMMVKYADNIRTNRLLLKNHHAHLRIIGILVALLIVIFMTNVIINILLFPLFPFDYVPVKSCLGVSISHHKEEERGSLIQIVSLVLMLVILIAGHVRIILFKSHHNRSYFSQNRQNVATLDQTFSAAYIALCLAICKAMNLIIIFANSDPAVDDEKFLKLMMFVNTIAVPCFWIISTWTNFKVFWSKETVFQNQFSQAQHKTIALQVSLKVLEPRRHFYQETTYITERSLSMTETLPGRFFYGIY